MDKNSLSERGLQLSLELEKLANHYNVRSDHHDILHYEAAIIKEKALDLVVKRDIPKHLRQSRLLVNNRMVSDKGLLQIIQNIRDFYQEYEEVKNEA